MEEGDFLRINYVGRIKENGQIFDLTDLEIAKKEGVYDPNIKYGPLPVILGAGFILKGLETVLREMKVGEKKKVVLKPEEAFGKRSEKLVKIIPESEFTKRNMVPYQGMPVNINNLMGRVQSFSGGRVKVDFNHPFAGKELEYDIEITEKITDKAEKISAIIEFFTGSPEAAKIDVKDSFVEVFWQPNREVESKEKKDIFETIKKWVDGISKVRFIEEYS